MLGHRTSRRTIKLDRTPRAPKFDVHVWADYVELLCLFNVDGEISRIDVVDRVRERARDLGEGSGPREEDVTGTPGASEADDRWSILVSDWFANLHHRQ